MWQLSNVSVSGGDQPSTVLEGSTFNYTIQTNTDANYEINSVQVLMGDRDITATAVTAGGEGEKSVTITIDSVSGNIKIIVSAVVAIKVLNDCTWAEISQISSSGQAANTFSVGDQKEIVLNGRAFNTNFNNQHVYAFIVGINHNASREGDNVIHFELYKHGDTPYAITTSDYGNSQSGGGKSSMMTTSDNSGGWANSDMRKNKLGGRTTDSKDSPKSGTFMSILPSDLRAVLRSVSKYTFNDSTPSKTSEYIFLYALYEVLGEPYDFGASNEVSFLEQYEYYKSGNSAIHQGSSRSGSVYFWTRSKETDYGTSFYMITDAGQQLINRADASLGVVTLFFV